MVMGAEEKLEKYLEENEEARKEYKINKKLKDDPRITKIGKFIRKTANCGRKDIPVYSG